MVKAARGAMAGAEIGWQAAGSGFTVTQWQTGPRLGAAETLAAYSQMPWLRAYLQKVSEDVASTPWMIMAVEGDGGRAIRDARIQRAARHKDRKSMMARYLKQGRLREIVDHPLIDVIGGGSDWFSGTTTMQLTQLHLDLIGELAWLLSLNQLGLPAEIVPIPPTWLQVIPPRGAGTFNVVGPSGAYEIPSDFLIYAYHPNPADPFRRGTGLAQVMGDELEVDEFAAKYVKDWFRNKAIPPVLIAGLGIQGSEIDRLEHRWLAKYAVKGTGWLPHFLGTDVQVHQLSQSFQQQELGSLREAEKNTIRQVIGIPPEIMGDVSQSNRSTIDGSNFVYQSRVVVPRLEFIRGVLQSLSERYDERIIVEFMSPVEEDREFVLKVREKSPWAWSVDEWREFGAGEALPAGKGRVYMLPFNLVPSRDFEVVAAPTPTPALPPGSPSPGAPEPPPPPEVPEIPPTEQPEPVDAPEGASKRVVKAIEDNVANAAETAVLVEAWHDLFQQLIEEFGQAAIDEALQDLGGVEIAFDVADPRIAQHMREFGAVRMEQVNETTQSAIAAQIADGLEASETFRELSARVQAVFQEARESRANLIVNTELTTSTNFASVTGLRQAGFKEKEWLATRDNKVRDTHVELDGTVVGIDENFVSPSGASGPYPGAMGAASEDCNCRCAVITVLANRALSFREAMWKTKDAQRLPWERRLTLAILPAFDKQEKAVIAELKRQLSKSARKRTRQAQPSLWEGREAASAVESL